MTVAKVTGMHVGSIDGQDVVILQTDAGEVALPAAGLMAILEDLRRKLSAQDAQKNQLTAGGWSRVNILQAQTLEVGVLPTTESEKVALTIDRGLPSELTVAFPPAHAQQLGSQLVEAATQAEQRRPRRH